MNKAPFAYVDAGMGGCPLGPEKDQVAGPNPIKRNAYPGELQSGHAARQANATGRFINVPNQAAAVKPRFRCIAAVAIRSPDQIKCVKGRFLGLLGSKPGSYRFC